LVDVAIAGAFGLLIGSFLNVVIHRLPKMMEREWRQQCAEARGEDLPEEAPYNIVKPRSACPHCGHAIRAWENIPLVSYAIQRGRCSACRAPISIRYPVVEAITGLLAAACVARFGPTLTAAAAFGFAASLVALTCIDLDTFLLPDSITLPLVWAGLLFNLAMGPSGFTDLRSAVIGAAAGYLILWSVYWAFKLATGKEGMGYGDFKLLAAIGAWFGWAMLPLAILASSAVGAAVGLSMIFLQRQGRDTPIPFGPYLAGAGLIILFWGKPLTQSYLGLVAH
jgi:leader peptidase (prepilin peptidase) / N-methyltransferase